MNSINVGVATGNLGGDAKVISKGKRDGTGMVVALNVALNSYYDGEEITKWATFKIFGKRAKALLEYLVKGTFVVIEYKLSPNVYENKDGDTVYSTDLIVTDINFKTPDGNGGSSQRRRTSKTRTGNAKQSRRKYDDEEFDDDDDDYDEDDF